LHPQNLARNSFVKNQKGKYEPVRSFIQLKQARNKLTKLIILLSTDIVDAINRSLPIN
jgi:hypothetical protein